MPFRISHKTVKERDKTFTILHKLGAKFGNGAANLNQWKHDGGYGFNRLLEVTVFVNSINGNITIHGNFPTKEKHHKLENVVSSLFGPKRFLRNLINSED